MGWGGVGREATQLLFYVQLRPVLRVSSAGVLCFVFRLL